MNEYLKTNDIIDWDTPAVLEKAKFLSDKDIIQTAKNCFEWVRDEIRHSHDYKMNPITGRASEVLEHGTGYCFAKSHLLAALLRANDIPAGFCYQRLSRDDNGPPYTLHGLVAVSLPEYGWYRIDPRGNRSDVNAQFSPPIEQLAFCAKNTDEIDLPEILSDPLPVVIKYLQKYKTWDQLWENLPDML